MFSQSEVLFSILQKNIQVVAVATVFIKKKLCAAAEKRCNENPPRAFHVIKSTKWVE